MIYFSVVINNNCFIKTLSLIKQQSLYTSDSLIIIGDVFMREKTANFSLYLPPKLSSRLAELGKETFQSKSSLIRMAIVEFLAK